MMWKFPDKIFFVHRSFSTRNFFDTDAVWLKNCKEVLRQKGFCSTTKFSDSEVLDKKNNIHVKKKTYVMIKKLKYFQKITKMKKVGLKDSLEIPY